MNKIGRCVMEMCCLARFFYGERKEFVKMEEAGALGMEEISKKAP